MRKIESDMMQAIKDGKEFIRDNTLVIITDHIGNPYLYATIYLHGNLIAEIDRDMVAHCNLTTSKRYPTRTTCSRLRALGIGAHLVKGEPCIDGMPV